MQSLSDRQASKVIVSGLPGARTIEWDLPPNMREMGDSAEFAYSCPRIRQNVKLDVRRKNNWRTL
jgi:hypothetical protein